MDSRQFSGVGSRSSSEETCPARGDTGVASTDSATPAAARLCAPDICGPAGATVTAEVPAAEGLSGEAAATATGAIPIAAAARIVNEDFRTARVRVMVLIYLQYPQHSIRYRTTRRENGCGCGKQAFQRGRTAHRTTRSMAASPAAATSTVASANHGPA